MVSLRLGGGGLRLLLCHFRVCAQSEEQDIRDAGRRLDADGIDSRRRILLQLHQKGRRSSAMLPGRGRGSTSVNAAGRFDTMRAYEVSTDR